MAFIRDYASQHEGDPFRFTTRAGRLVHPQSRIPDFRFARKVRLAPGALPRFSRAAVAGDPFSFKLPKFVRKITLKKVVSGVGKLAKAALPIAATVLTGGIGGAALGLASRFIGGGGSAPPEEPAPPMDAALVEQPFQGPVGAQNLDQRLAQFGVDVNAYAYEDEDEYDDEDEDEYDDEDEDEYLYADEDY